MNEVLMELIGSPAINRKLTLEVVLIEWIQYTTIVMSYSYAM